MPELQTRTVTTRSGKARVQRQRVARVECVRCGRVVSLVVWPGQAPVTCSDACTVEYKRAESAKRMRTYRERKLSGSGSAVPLRGQPMLPGFENVTAVA